MLNTCRKNRLYIIIKTREDKGDREGIPHTYPILGNSSRVIFKTIDPKGD